MQQSAVPPVVGVAVPPPMPMAQAYDYREVAYRVLNFWGMMVMITGILSLLCSIFAGIPAIVAGSMILCECCRGGAFLTRSAAGTVITLAIISAAISPAILIAYLAVAIRYRVSAYVGPIFILTFNTITSAVLASKTRKHRDHLPDFADSLAVAAPDAVLVAAPAPYPPGGVYSPYPAQHTGGMYPQQHTGGMYPQQNTGGMYPAPAQYGAAPGYGQPGPYPATTANGQPDYQAPPPGKTW